MSHRSSSHPHPRRAHSNRSYSRSDSSTVIEDRSYRSKPESPRPRKSRHRGSSPKTSPLFYSEGKLTTSNKIIVPLSEQVTSLPTLEQVSAPDKPVLAQSIGLEGPQPCADAPHPEPTAFNVVNPRRIKLPSSPVPTEVSAANLAAPSPRCSPASTADASTSSSPTSLPEPIQTPSDLHWTLRLPDRNGQPVTSPSGNRLDLPSGTNSGKLPFVEYQSPAQGIAPCHPKHPRFDPDSGAPLVAPLPIISPPSLVMLPMESLGANSTPSGLSSDGNQGQWPPFRGQDDSSINSNDISKASDEIVHAEATEWLDPIELLSRVQTTVHNMANISAALPDLESLLAAYKSAEQPSEREKQLHKLESQHHEELRQKEQHIDILSKQLEAVAERQRLESQKLRFEKGNLEEKLKDLGDRLAATEAALRGAEGRVEVSDHEMRAAAKRYDDWKREEHRQYESEKRELDARWKTCVDEERTAASKAQLETRNQTQQEIQAIKHRHEAEKSRLQRVWDEERVQLAERHQRDVSETKREFIQVQAQLNSDSEWKLSQLEKDKERLLQDGITDKENLKAERDDCRRRNRALHAENTELQNLLRNNQGYTNLKTEDDTFFIDAYRTINNDVTEFSRAHFSSQPSDGAQSSFAKIPIKIPNFLDNTPAAIDLRAAYIQYLVHSIIDESIYQLFFFGKYQNPNKGDDLLKEISRELFVQSPKREAFWRQETLKIAYTSEGRKKAMNKLAYKVVDQILEKVMPFAESQRRPEIMTALRRIVKNATETWRLARLVRERIISEMPTINALSVKGAHSKDYHHGTALDREQMPTLENELLFHLQPKIYREVAQGDLADDKDSRSSPRIYSQGKALYSNSPCVIMRKKELAEWPHPGDLVTDSAGVDTGPPPPRPPPFPVPPLFAPPSPVPHLSIPNPNMRLPPGPPGPPGQPGPPEPPPLAPPHYPIPGSPDEGSPFEVRGFGNLGGFGSEADEQSRPPSPRFPPRHTQPFNEDHPAEEMPEERFSRYDSFREDAWDSRRPRNMDESRSATPFHPFPGTPEANVHDKGATRRPPDRGIW